MRNPMEVASRIQMLHLNLLPPYAEDLDEGKRSQEDYLAFFRGKAKEFAGVVRKYRDSLRAGLRDPDDPERLNAYFDARAAFVRGLPFCSEQIVDISREDAAWFIQRLWKQACGDLSAFPDLAV